MYRHQIFRMEKLMSHLRVARSSGWRESPEREESLGRRRYRSYFHGKYETQIRHWS
jgi:hypothetical protein